MERELIQDLVNQGYEFLPRLVTQEAMLANVREQLQDAQQCGVYGKRMATLCGNLIWTSPVTASWIKHEKFTMTIFMILCLTMAVFRTSTCSIKRSIVRNKVQVIKQFEQTGTHANRYDVTILVNGLPLVQVELKKRGVAIREAFNQVHRYSKESFNTDEFSI